MSPLDPLLQTTAWTLLHFLWQGCLIWLATLLALVLARSRSPQVRYLVACAGLALCLLLPMATFAHLRPTALRQAGELALAARDSPPATLATVALPFGLGAAVLVPQRLGYFVEGNLVWLLRGWLFGCLLLALRFGGGWLHLLTVRRAVSRSQSAQKQPG